MQPSGGCRRQLFWIGLLGLGICAFLRGMMDPGADSSEEWLIAGLAVTAVAFFALVWRAFASSGVS